MLRNTSLFCLQDVVRLLSLSAHLSRRDPQFNAYSRILHFVDHFQTSGKLSGLMIDLSSYAYVVNKSVLQSTFVEPRACGPVALMW